jgi:hypothetical protein
LSALSKVRRGEQIHNPAGLLFKALDFNSGAKLDLKNLDSERKKRLAEKEKKYEGLYLSRETDNKWIWDHVVSVDRRRTHD